MAPFIAFALIAPYALPLAEALPTVFVSHADTTDGWWAARFTLPVTSRVAASVKTFSQNVTSAYNYADGLWIWNQTTGQIYVLSTAGAMLPRTVTHVQIDTFATDTYSHQESGQRLDGVATFHAAANTLPPGEYLVAGAATATGLASVTYEVSAEPGAGVTAMRNGSGARLWREWEFNGTLVVSEERPRGNIVFRDPVPDASNTIRVVVDATLTFESQGRLFGGLVGAGQIGDMSVEPSGQGGSYSGGSTCWHFMDAPPGTYTVGIGRYAAAGRETEGPQMVACPGEDPLGATTANDALLLFAVDVELP